MTNFGSVIQDFLANKYKGCEYVCGETYESIIWMEGNVVPKPTIQECIDGIEDYEKNKNYYQYKLLRKRQYGSINDMLDMLWHSMDSGEIPKSAAFYEHCKSVKDKFPKAPS